MKKLLAVSRRSGWTRPALTLFLAVGLGLILWLITSPVAIGRLLTPTEMIEAGLPPGMVMKKAGKPQFLTAVCAAVKNNRKASPAIAKTAVGAHGEYAGDIVATVVRCTRGEGTADCELTGAIVAAAIAAAPDSAAVIDDAAIAIAPDCADAIQNAHEDIPAEGPSNFSGQPPSNQTPLFGGIGGGGGFNPQESQVQICDNGRQRGIRASRVSHYLDTHPGSFIGVCQITPSTSR